MEHGHPRVLPVLAYEVAVRGCKTRRPECVVRVPVRAEWTAPAQTRRGRPEAESGRTTRCTPGSGRAGLPASASARCPRPASPAPLAPASPPRPRVSVPCKTCVSGPITHAHTHNYVTYLAQGIVDDGVAGTHTTRRTLRPTALPLSLTPFRAIVCLQLCVS